MTTKLLAFHGDPKIKQKYLDRVRAHATADEIIQGKYWENGKGCAVGCTIHGSDHEKYETKLGIPSQVAYLEDSIFEGLPLDKAKLWPEKFLKAIKPGADLSKVFPRFVIWMLIDPKDGVWQYAFEDGKSAIKGIADLYERRLRDDEPERDEWAERAAEAERAERAARAAWAAEAERAARAAGAAGAAEAARAARAAGAARAARAAECQSKKLLELLREVK